MLFRKKKKNEEPAPVFDKEIADYWRSIPIGSSISLTDEAAIEEAMRIGEGVKGLNYIVRQAERFRDTNHFGEWWFYFIEGHKTENLWLLIKIIDNQITPIVYFEVEDFPPTLRRRLIADGQTWPFDLTEDDDQPHAPIFARDIFQTVEDEDGDELEVHYRLKPQGTVYGTGPNDSFTAWAEYEADESFENPELLLIEKGGEDDLDGGLVSLYVGGMTVFNDIEVLRVNA